MEQPIGNHLVRILTHYAEEFRTGQLDDVVADQQNRHAADKHGQGCQGLRGNDFVVNN